MFWGGYLRGLVMMVMMDDRLRLVVLSVQAIIM